MTSRDGLLIFLVATIFCLVALPMVLGGPGIHRNGNLYRRQDPSAIVCTTDLAPDLYGLGVRIGIYFQWLSGWVSNSFIVDEIQGGLDGNAIFLFAILIGMVNSTRSDAMTLVDGLIMLLLCAGTVVGVLSLWGYRTCAYRKDGHHGISKFGGFGTHLRLLLAGGVGWYGMWYWTVGIKGLPAGLTQFGPVSDTCNRTEVTVFNAPLKGIASSFALAISAIALAYSVILTLASPIAAVTRLRKMYHFLRTKQYASTTRLRYATGATQKQLTIASYFFRYFTLCWLLFIALMIEIILNENYQIGVLGGTPVSENGQILQPAQLLPMLIGAFSFARILFVAFELWRAPNGDITPSLGRNASKRYSRAKPTATKGMNIFKLFAEAEADPEHDEHSPEAARHWDDGHDESYYDLHERLNVWQRILITWLPWFSLFWFWPWSSDVDRPTSAGEDHIHLKPRSEPISLQTPHRTRFTRFEDEIEEEPLDTSYHRPSSVSTLERFEVQKPAAMV